MLPIMRNGLKGAFQEFQLCRMASSEPEFAALANPPGLVSAAIRRRVPVHKALEVAAGSRHVCGIRITRFNVREHLARCNRESQGTTYLGIRTSFVIRH